MTFLLVWALALTCPKQNKKDKSLSGVRLVPSKTIIHLIQGLTVCQPMVPFSSLGYFVVELSGNVLVWVWYRFGMGLTWLFG